MTDSQLRPSDAAGASAPRWWRGLLCFIGLHSPDRSQVSWGGDGFVGHCAECAVPLRRVRRRVWRRDRRPGR